MYSGGTWAALHVFLLVLGVTTALRHLTSPMEHLPPPSPIRGGAPLSWDPVELSCSLTVRLGASLAVMSEETDVHACHDFKWMCKYMQQDYLSSSTRPCPMPKENGTARTQPPETGHQTIAQVDKVCASGSCAQSSYPTVSSVANILVKSVSGCFAQLSAEEQFRVVSPRAL